jgi:hypothetical protein
VNAPVKHASLDASGPARQQELREIIAEMLWSCGICCDTGLNYIELSDDAGLEYSIRQLIAHVKVARDVMAMLKASTVQKAEFADAT